jgi:hypothetical protein
MCSYIYRKITTNILSAQAYIGYDDEFDLKNTQKQVEKV